MWYVLSIASTAQLSLSSILELSMGLNLNNNTFVLTAQLPLSSIIELSIGLNLNNNTFVFIIERYK